MTLRRVPHYRDVVWCEADWIGEAFPLHRLDRSDLWVNPGTPMLFSKGVGRAQPLTANVGWARDMTTKEKEAEDAKA